MHQAPSDRDEQPELPREKPSGLSAHDPAPDTATSRSPVLLIIVVVLVVTGFVVLHLTGIVGPGAH